MTRKCLDCSQDVTHITPATWFGCAVHAAEWKPGEHPLMPELRKYAQGTQLEVTYPWRTYIGGKAMCSDGKVRTLKRIAATADTFFSVPASVEVKGKTVAGSVTLQSEEGYSVATENDPAIVKFSTYLYRKNHALLPEGLWKRSTASK